MYLERALRGIAGAFIVLSVILSHYHSPWWLLFTLFVGLNLFQSAITDCCPMMNILKYFGVKCQKDQLQQGGA